MKNKVTNPYARDVFLSTLIRGARRTYPDGYPIIEKWMVPSDFPQNVVQWDCKTEALCPEKTCMNFYCNDINFAPILNNPHLYVEKLKIYSSVVGLDPSPYDNMPLVVQKSQIYTGLAVSYFFGTQGISIIPNVRPGNDDTMGMLDAIPKETLIAVGTNGFVQRNKTRESIKAQMKVVIDVLRPSGIIVYGPEEDIFDYAKSQGVEVRSYPSHTMNRNEKRRRGA